MRLEPDNRSFRLVEPAEYSWCHAVEGFEALRLVVPEGFNHDFASVPRPLWWFISPIDLGLATVFHDWLYRHAGEVETLGRRPGSSEWDSIETPWVRRDADRLFARMMRESDVTRFRRRTAFRAVHWFGERGWGRARVRSRG